MSAIQKRLFAFMLMSLGVVGAACSSSSSSRPADGGGSGSATGGGGNGSGSGGAGGLAGGKLGITQCSDGVDNDGDGRIDLNDVECVSPLDNDESSFATGIPGDNVDSCKQDCFFDGNSGMGDDGCEWQLKCDPLNTGTGATASCPFDPNASNCPGPASAKCQMNCGAVTPNGCDCFGCCVVPGLDHAIRLDASCTSAGFNDPAKCPACTQQTSCMKTCGPCQLCLGKTTIDPSCTPGPDGGAGTDGGSATDGGSPGLYCPGTQIVCGTNGNACPNGTLCVTGCCVPWVF